MKRTKKIAGLLMALAMLLTLGMTAFAAQEGTLDSGSITISDAVPGQEYKAYQILYLESYDPTSGTYAYKANSAWESWLKTQNSYVNFDDQDYVTWVKKDDAGNDTGAADFAKMAQEQAASMAGDATVTAPAAKEGETYSEVTFSGLKLGYYLVDTTLGSLCSLDTTNPSVTMQEKNEVPSIEKQVREGENWGVENSAQIGDTIEFKTTVNAKPGAASYVLHDDLSEGLTLNSDSIQVTVSDTTLNAETDYTLRTSGFTDGCDFEIAFAKDYLDGITANTDIVVTYTAVLNEKAVVSVAANTNKTFLSYGNKETQDHTPENETKTYTYQFDLVKTKNDNTLLTGAKFRLYDKQTNGNEIALVKVTDGEYRVAAAADKVADAFSAAEIEAGKAVIKGLDADTYWLEETKAPEGYNKLKERVKVEISSANLTAVVNGNTWTNGGVHVTNQAGSLLPSTGGTGTTIFYILGGILVIGAALLLIAKRFLHAKK